MRVRDFSTDQEAALEQIERWRNNRTKQYLTLGGYAGTGKSTLVHHLADSWPGLAVVTLCGKAASVLIEKGIPAQTIHSLIYIPFKDAMGKVRFRRRSDLGAVSAIIVDEASMIGHVLLQDVLSFNLPVLFVGDHGQLEPIGTDANLMCNPDIRLEKIHRQAMDNPILRLATAFRAGRRVPYWKDKHGRVVLTHRDHFERLIRPDIQIICGFNKTRHKVNGVVREILEAKSKLPVANEKLICLRNNSNFGIFNGQQVICRKVLQDRKHWLELDIEIAGGATLTVPCSRHQFGCDTLKDHKDTAVTLFDFGYCLTAHKAQGSEWDDVLAIEELSTKWDARRWRYTVSTRAKKRLVYCFE